MRKNSANTEKVSKKKPKKLASSFDHARKYDIIGILMIVFALLVTLAFVSHTASDEAVADISFGEFLKLFAGDAEIQARADTTANWLGLFGAMMSRFFINSTIGYFSFVLPLLLAIWGWFTIARRDQTRVITYYTNYTLIAALLLATMTGLLRLLDWLVTIPPSWSGAIGDFTAGVLSRVIGTPGGIILVFTLLVVVAVIAIDYDIRKTMSRIAAFFSAMHQNSKERKEEKALLREEAALENTDDVDPQDEIPAEEPPPPAKRQRRRKEDAPLPKATAVSIDRQDSQPIPVNGNQALGTLQPQPVPVTNNSPRSNGSIAKESIPGLASILEEAAGKETLSPEIRRPDPVVENPVNGQKQHIVEPLATPAAVDEEPGEFVELDSGEISELVDPSKLDDVEDLDKGSIQTPNFVNGHDKLSVRKSVGTALTNGSKATPDLEEANAELATARLPYQKPKPDLLDFQERTSSISDEELRIKGELLKEKLAVFGINITKISVTPGPVVTMFELVPDSSVKISKIVSLSDDLALALAARGIRIIAPIPGKGAVGVEIPNNEPELVDFRSVVKSSQFRTTKAHLPLAIGKSITGEVYCTDLAKMPHLLIAGATGAGKSVGINTMISSLLYSQHPSDVKMVMIDPKKIELAQYKGLENHFLAKCPDIDEVIITDPGNAVIALKSLEMEMDNRYTKLAKAGVRHVTDYNEKVAARVLKDTDTIKHYKLPYIVVIIDELADLMITAAREVEEPIARLAQLARAVGIHLIVATQRPSVDVLTGVIKANFPARIAYKVASRVDSRTILDGSGADRLLGNGDLLYQPTGYPKPIRIQNAFLSTAEVERVVEFIEAQRGYLRPYLLPSVNERKKGKAAERDIGTDDLLVDAARLIVRHQQGSVSLLQRRLKIGYSRAARIVDQLELAGIVGPSDGSKAREVLIDDEIAVDQLLED